MGSKHPDTPDATRTYRAPARAGEGEGYALLVSAPSGTRVVALPGGGTFTLGRGAGCEITIADDSLSREHARLTIGDTVTICDLGSKNGTSLAGERLPAGTAVALTLGTPIELGAVMVVLQRGMSAVTSTPPPSPAPTRKGARTHTPVIADPGMRHLYALLDVVAPSPLSVLVLGETGVGKEVYAEAIHARSSRADKPFVPLHCAALPETLLEAELFGYEKGAFTGATQKKPGIFESADGGTVFLDEIGEVPLATQARLLRVLETGEVMRLGSVRPITVDVRFVSATHRDLRGLIAAQQFRADLYFRLNGMSIHLPPLRSRKADVRALAEMFVEKSAKAMKRGEITFTDEAMARLEAYDWPGNVRELRNVLDRAVLLSSGKTIDVSHLEVADPEVFGAPAVARPSTPHAAAAASAPAGDEDQLKARLVELEQKKIEDALAKHAGNQSQAAKFLGISRFTLMNKMEAFGLARPRKGR